MRSKGIFRNLAIPAIVASAIVVLFSMLTAILYAPINADASYYLAIPRLIMDGYAPFRDFALSYTPLSFYMMCLPRFLFGDSFGISMAFLYVAQIVNIFLVKRLCDRYTDSALMSWLYAMLFALASLCLDGQKYVLEPFVLMFGLSALLVLETNRDSCIAVISAGLLCFCSFMCKQYGLGFICMSVVWVALNAGTNRIIIKTEVRLIAGFVIGMLLSLFLAALNRIPIENIITLAGSDYARHGIRGLVSGWMKLIFVLPALLFAVVVAISNIKDALKDKVLICSVLGMAGYSIPLLVRSYRHYLLLIIPFGIMLIAAAAGLFKRDKWKSRFEFFVLLTLLIPMVQLAIKDCHMISSDERTAQINLAAELSEAVPVGTKDVFVSFPLLAESFINQYLPPKMDKYGMSNGFVEDEESVLDMMSEAEYIVFTTENEYSTEIETYIQDNYMRILDSSANFQIFKRCLK